MSIFRTETDINTGEIVVINQAAYTDGKGNFLVLDDGVPTPAGYELAGEIPPPPSPTYSQALASLNSAYQSDVSKLNMSYSLALLADGPTEATKLSAIRAQYETRKTQHAAAIAALKLEYGV